VTSRLGTGKWLTFFKVYYSAVHVHEKIVKFGTEDLLEEPNERDHDDGGEHAEWEGLEEGAQVQHH
jgi:hypothetical protein